MKRSTTDGEGLVDLEEVDVVERSCRRARSTFSVTSTGPVSMMRRLGADIGEGADARARLQARGLRRASFEPISTAAAPSTMPEELPAWWTWLTLSISGWAWIATASKPPISPICTKEGLSAPSDCMSVAGPHVLVAVEDA